MKNKEVNFGYTARTLLSEGVEILNKAVYATLGPSGRNAVIEKENGNPTSTKDGVSVAKAIKLKDKNQNIGVELVRQAAIKTADEAGDGTTTSTLLASHLFLDGTRSIEESNIRVNTVEFKRGIDKAVKDITDYLKSISIDITEEEQIEQVATISGNNDPEIGKLISSAMDNSGTDGVITIEESRTGETYLETVEGMQFDRGFKSPYFVTDNSSMSAILDNPLVLLIDKRVNAAKELLPILEACSSQNKSLLIIADDIDGEALSTLVVNKMRGIVSVVAVKAPDFGDRKKATLEDIATLTGGKVVSSEKGMRLEKFESDWLGKARKVTVTKDTTTIVDGKGEEADIESRIEDLKSQIDNTNSPFEKENLQNRLGRLVGGVGIIHVGGNTEVEIKERRDRVEDALHATKAALEEGILPGGGLALLRAYDSLYNESDRTDDQSLGYYVALETIRKPFYQILLNVYEHQERVQEIEDYILEQENLWLGFNPLTEEYSDFLQAGIIDPTKVTRLALTNAASVAGTLLTTETLISIDSSDNSNSGDIDNSILENMI